MKFRASIITFLLFGAAVAVLGQQRPQQRCGWFENPTPANAWLTDKDGMWIISTQGAGSADGDWPSFSSPRWIKTNGHYGYGCACLKMVVDTKEKSVTKILAAASRPISACRRDRSIAKKEPKP